MSYTLYAKKLCAKVAGISGIGSKMKVVSVQRPYVRNYAMSAVLMQGLTPEETQKHHPRAVEACLRKAKYLSRKAARKAARRTSRALHLSSFKCDVCGFFHNGRLQGWQETARGKKWVDSHTVLDLPAHLLEETPDGVNR